MSPPLRAPWFRPVLALVVLLAAGVAPAQQDAASAQAPGRVFPPTTDVVGKVVSPAEATTMNRKVGAILDTLLQTPALAQPRGFSIRQHIRLYTPPPGMPKHHPAVAKAQVLLQRINLQDKATVVDKATGTSGGVGEGPTVHLHANDQTAQFANPMDRDAQGNNYYELPVTPRTLHGFPLLKVRTREVIVIAKAGRQPFAHVTKQRYLEGRIAEARKQAGASGGKLQQLEDELASLSPEEKGSPACRSSRRKRGTSFVPCQDSGAQYIVTLHPDYFDKALPKTALQLLTISVAPQGSRLDKLLEPVLRSAVEQLDLAALQRSLE